MEGPVIASTRSSAATSAERAGLDRTVFFTSISLVLAVVVWGLVAPESLQSSADVAFSFVTGPLGWMFSLLTIAVFGFVMWIGFGPHRHIPLGKDGDKPEYSTISWVGMIFACGVGVGLLFYGPYEPLTFFMKLPPIYEAIEPQSQAAMFKAMAQTLFHWGPVAWAYYALVGAAMAYSAYRKGRTQLMSRLLEPIFGARTRGPLGAAVDVAAIIVTLFGTAISLGIGTLQIGRGYEIVSGAPPLTNAALVVVMTFLGVGFIFSAVSGIKRGIRILSNINTGIMVAIAVAVFIFGPTLLITNLIPGGFLTFVGDLPALMAQSVASSKDAGEFMSAWTTYYWAWWVSWTPFVGMFIAKISKGRTLREFVVTVVLVPSAVCLVWFTVLGGTAMRMEQNGAHIDAAGSPQNVLFAVLDALPGGRLWAAAALGTIVVLFVTGADSASLVMGTLAERGRAVPSKWLTILFGAGLTAVAAVLLVVGGNAALNEMQQLMIVASVPFALVVVLVMVAWGKELNEDPLSLRASTRKALAAAKEENAASSAETEPSA
ncbi:MAG: BCCT family transporter [Cellulomonadaceae bacterium]|jgi:choline/carnitine/betaine transport|nr:BCCT family transporter [Cellulomonadaceae bacterium]